MLQTSVEIVKPGGTGRPALVIRARPEPLPPRRSFMWRLPSALPLPKKKTYCRCLGLGIRDLGFVVLRDSGLVAVRFALDFFAIIAPVESMFNGGCANADANRRHSR